MQKKGTLRKITNKLFVSPAEREFGRNQYELIEGEKACCYGMKLDKHQGNFNNSKAILLQLSSPGRRVNLYLL